MSKNNNKTSDQMRQETIDALEQFKKNLKEYLNNGNYELKYINRHYDTQEISSVDMELNGTRLFIQKDEAEVFIRVFAKIEDLINPQVIKLYNKLTIDRDIDFYEEKLRKLRAQKAIAYNEEPQETDEDNVPS